MTHGPCTIQIAFDDPMFGPLSVGGAVGIDPEARARLQALLPVGGGPSPWHLRVFDAQASLLEDRAIAPGLAERLLGDLQARVGLARQRAL